MDPASNIVVDYENHSNSRNNSRIQIRDLAPVFHIHFICETGDTDSI